MFWNIVFFSTVDFYLFLGMLLIVTDVMPIEPLIVASLLADDKLLRVSAAALSSGNVRISPSSLMACLFAFKLFATNIVPVQNLHVFLAWIIYFHNNG